MTNQIQYLNTDLEIRSRRNIAPILDALGEKVFVLHQSKRGGHYFVSLEISAIRKTPGQTINIFCSLIDQLPKKARSIWNRCHSRVFDLGYESGRAPKNFHSALPLSIVKRVADIGASIVITIYPTGLKSLPNKRVQPTLSTHKPRGQRG
jgi:hypothetical protein